MRRTEGTDTPLYMNGNTVMNARGWRKENGGSLCLEDLSSPSFSAERDVKGML